MRRSNMVIGFINFLTFLLSIPILGAAIYLATKANSGQCLRFLQWPLLAISLSVLLISLVGFAGSCYRVTYLLRIYLVLMFLLIAALLCLVIFAFAVTGKGGGRPVLSRVYLDYRLEDYEGWLKDRVADPEYWGKIASCVRGSGVCRKMGRSVMDTATGAVRPEPVEMFYMRNLSPIQSGCCKPPSSCGFTYLNETTWTPVNGSPVNNIDCTRWSNDQQLLCYRCDSCKAGVLANLKDSWRKASIVTVVVLIVLVIVYVIAIAAYRNNRRMDDNSSDGMNRMSKSHPTRFQF